MKKNILIVTFTLVLSIICGCSIENSQNSDELPKMIEVNIAVEPANPEPNEQVTLKAIVTQGDEKVEDANEVTFEVWKEGQEDHEMIEGHHQGGGVYSISKQFTEAGMYYVVSHVTARDMHMMPKQEFIVRHEEGHQHNDGE